MIVTHSEMVLDAVAERLIVFDGNKVDAFDGNYEDFLSRIGWEDEADRNGNEARTEETPAKGVLKKNPKGSGRILSTSAPG